MEFKSCRAVHGAQVMQGSGTEGCGKNLGMVAVAVRLSLLVYIMYIIGLPDREKRGARKHRLQIEKTCRQIMQSRLHA